MSQTPDDLEQRIKAAQDRQLPPAEPEKGSSATATALRAGTDMVAALLVGGFLGYLLDGWLDTRPWLMIVFLFLGFAAGFLNIYRAQMGNDFEVGFKSTKLPLPKSTDDNANKE